VWHSAQKLSFAKACADIRRKAVMTSDTVSSFITPIFSLGFKAAWV